MKLLSALGTVLFPIAMGLLLEELTFGGLVRLMLAPWPWNRKHEEHKNRNGERKCSR